MTFQVDKPGPQRETTGQSPKGKAMPIKKWILQYVAMLAVLSVVLALVQYSKGRDWEYSVQFGVLWAFNTATLFLGTRIYYYWKNIHCAVCNDLPGPENSSDEDT